MRKYGIILSIILLCLLALIRVLQIDNEHLLMGFTYVYSIIATIYIATRFLFAAIYKPYKNNYNTTVSIVVAVYNEELFITKTIDKIYQSNKIPDEVIIVDDGSTDKTPDILKQLEIKYPKLMVINFAKNKGKREALVSGVNKSTSDVIVFIDSDTQIEKDTISEIIKPFIDKKVKAVAGQVKVLPITNTLVERLQHSWYYTAWRIFRSSESIFGAVTCLSGILSAYRRESFMEISDDFVNQKFLGVKTTVGDDRSLTTMLLRKGYKVVYQSTALCRSIVPSSFKVLMKQRLRWKKSWIRENLLQAKFYYKYGIGASLGLYPMIFIGFTSIIIVSYYTIYMPISGDFRSLIGFIFGCMALGLVQVAYYLWNNEEKGQSTISNILYWFINTFVFIWILPVALIKIRGGSWGTRGNVIFDKGSNL